jgi:hypothetical protein
MDELVWSDPSYLILFVLVFPVKASRARNETTVSVPCIAPKL